MLIVNNKSAMKYPLENVSVWDLIRHPFDEESGDPGGRTFMRLLSNIFFPIYVFLQIWVPFQVTMNVCLDTGQTDAKVEQVEHIKQSPEPSVDPVELLVDQKKLSDQQKDPVWLTVITVFFVWLSLLVGFWAVWVILSVLVRYFTSIYFNKHLIVIFCGALCLCTKKGSPNNIKWNERLDVAMIELGMVKAVTGGKELSLEDIANPAMDFDAIDDGVRAYMEDHKGNYCGNTIAVLFLFLTAKKMILSDNLALFYRILNSCYPDDSWKSDNAVLKAVNRLAGKEKLAELQKGIDQKYFSQIQTD
jgi:hypothetical protein